MPLFDVAYKLCLDDSMVPMYVKSLRHADAVHDPATHEYMCLNLKANGNLRWLEMGLKLKFRWWKQYQNQVPLIREIKEAIRSTRCTHGVGGRHHSSCMPKAVLPITVRGRKLFAVNRYRGLTIACKSYWGEDRELLRWLLEQLAQDLEAWTPVDLEHNGEPEDLQEGGPLSDDEASEAEEEEEEDLETEPPDHLAILETRLKRAREEAVTTLRLHPRCEHASFYPSRLSFSLKRKGGMHKCFRVAAHNKRLKLCKTDTTDTSWTGLKHAYDLSVNMGLAFLDSNVGDEVEDVQ